MKAVVLDASALLAMFFGQPGMQLVGDLFRRAAEADKPLIMNSVNWAEVLYKLEQKKGSNGLETGRLFERTMPLDIVATDRALAEIAAQMKAAHGLGLADAFAAATAIARKADLVTADREFKVLEKTIKVAWLT